MCSKLQPEHKVAVAAVWSTFFFSGNVENLLSGKRYVSRGFREQAICTTGMFSADINATKTIPFIRATRMLSAHINATRMSQCTRTTEMLAARINATKMFQSIRTTRNILC